MPKILLPLNIACNQLNLYTSKTKLFLTNFFQLRFVRIHQRVCLNGADLHFIKRVNKTSRCGMRRWFNEYYHARIGTVTPFDRIFLQGMMVCMVHTKTGHPKGWPAKNVINSIPIPLSI